MASSVTVDAVAQSAAPSSQTSLTWTHVINAAATAIVIFVAQQTDNLNLTSVKVGTTACTLLGSTNEASGANGYCLYCYGLLRPPTGSQTITVALSASIVCGGSVSFFGAGSFGTPVAAGNGTGIISVSVPSSSSSFVVDAVVSDGATTGATSTPSPNTTSFSTLLTTGDCQFAGSELAGGAADVLGWTLSPAITALQIGVEVKFNGAVAAAITGTSSSTEAITGAGILAGNLYGFSSIEIANGQSPVGFYDPNLNLLSWFDVLFAANGMFDQDYVLGIPGTIVSPVIITGTSAVVAAVTNFSGGGAFAAAIAASATATGAITGAGALAGVISASGTVVAAIGGSGALAGVITAPAVVSASLQGAGALAGAITAPAVVSASLIGSGALAGAVQGSSAIVAALTGAGSLAAVISGASAVTATITGVGSLAAGINGTSTLVVSLTGAGSLAAVIGGASSVTVTVSGFSGVAADISATSMVVTALGASGQLVASISGASSVSATLAGFAALLAAIVGSSAVTCSMIGLSGISCDIEGFGTVVCDIEFGGNLIANIQGRAVLFGMITRLLNAQILTTIEQTNAMIQALVPSATTAVTLSAIQSNMARIAVEAPQVVDNQPLVISVSTLKSSLLMKAITAIRQAKMITPPGATLEALKVQEGALFIVYRRLCQQNLYGLGENQGPT